MIDAGDLCTASDIARRCGVKPSAVSNWRKRNPSFPKPVIDMPGATLWSLTEIVAWDAQRAARPPRTNLEARVARLEGALMNLLTALGINAKDVLGD